MAKILHRKEKTVLIEGKQRTTSKERTYFVSDATKDFSCSEGNISAKDLQKPAGSLIATNKGAEFTVFDAQTKDCFERISRAPQIIPPKDIGLIITETGISRDSTVLDAGVGSGALACSLALIAKKVVSYDIEDEHLAVAESNKKFLGLTNLTIKKGDITQGVKETGFDVFTLDIGNPWEALETADKALKIGGFLVSYSPTVPQVMDFVEAVRKHTHFIIIKTSYVMEQTWEVKARKVRPESGSIVHSGFLTFVRKIV